MTMDNCRNIMFANLWFYRVVRVMTPRDYGTLVSNCENIEFRNNRTWTQIICETAATVYDMNRNVSIYPLAFAYGKVSGNESSRCPEGRVGEAVKIGKGYSFASGATRDSKGNVYFCEGIYGRFTNGMLKARRLPCLQTTHIGLFRWLTISLKSMTMPFRRRVGSPLME